MKEIRYWTSHPYKSPVYWGRCLGLSASEFSLVYDEKDPDYLIATEHIYFERLAKLDFQRLYAPQRVAFFWAGEAISPDFNLFDYAMTYDKGLSLGDRCVRRPVLSIFADFDHEPLDVPPIDPIRELNGKTGFCNFIYANPAAHPRRDQLFHEISKIKRVDSLGPHLHNCDARTSRGDARFAMKSVEMKRPYKFSIASENAAFSGYTSEKLITSFLARSIPIYWGNPDVASEFNPKAFINANRLSTEELLDVIRRYDESDELWVAMMSESPMTREQFERATAEEAAYRMFMAETFARPLTLALRRPEGYWTDNYRRTVFGASARQVTRQNRILKALGRETRLGRWVLSKVHPVK